MKWKRNLRSLIFVGHLTVDVVDVSISRCASLGTQVLSLLSKEMLLKAEILHYLGCMNTQQLYAVVG